MIVSVQHKTAYEFETASYSGLQRLHLRPSSNHMQKVHQWEIALSGAAHEVGYEDHFGNLTDLVKFEAGAHHVEILVSGQVETFDRAGVFGFDQTRLPNWVYQRPTKATLIGKNLRSFVADYRKNDGSIGFFHTLSEAIRTEVAYETGATSIHTTAEESWMDKKGVCQDHAHIMIAAARALGFAARYVSGYLLMDDRTEQTATHAWCEIMLEGLGWVGFDVSNGISPDGRYIRLAVGGDYHDALPIKGLRYGSGQEGLDVSLQIQQ